MNEEEKKEYISMLLSLMRKNGITILDLVMFGIDELCELERYDDITRRNITESLCDKLKDNI